MSSAIRRATILLCFIPFSVSVFAQEAQSQKPGEATKPLTASARLVAAKTAYVKRAAGADVAYDAIRYAIEGWGRYVIVSKPEDSDITIEVSAPADSDSGVAISSSTTTTNNTSGRPEQSSNTTRSFSGGGGPVRLTVYDSKSKMLLFVASELAKSALKQKNREDNLVSAASKLVTRFRDRVEPPAAQ